MFKRLVSSSAPLLLRRSASSTICRSSTSSVLSLRNYSSESSKKVDVFLEDETPTSKDLEIGTHILPGSPDELRIKNVINGIKLDGKSVLIYRPSRITMQTGTLRTRKWRLELPTNDKWHDGLMGWWASAGTLGQLNLTFASEEAAVGYCKENGLNYEVLPEDVVTTKKKRYGYRFLYKGDLEKTQEDETDIK